jgi:mycothiol synthase
MTTEQLITRAPTMDDLPGVVGLIRAYDAAAAFDLGNPTDDIRHVWTDPDFNLAEQAWLVVTPAGQIVGYMECAFDDDEAELDGYIHPEYTERGIGEHLLTLVDEKLRGSGMKANHTVPVSDTGMIALFETFGYRWSRGHWVMEIDITEPPTPVWPAGVELRPFDKERDSFAAYEVVTSAFAWNQKGEVETYEEWSKKRFDRADYNPELYQMVWQGDQLVACSLNVYRRPDLGWVRLLAVRDDWRGKGLGKALLHHSFADFYHRGTPKIGLAVDSQNPTGATRLYQNVGMQIVEQYSQLTKEFPKGE